MDTASRHRILDLTYCTNVHALGTVQEWQQTLGFFGPILRNLLGWEAMPLGLWWQASLAETMQQAPKAMVEFLHSIGVKPFTCNGFPFGNFHESVVKTKVYLPDWTTAERLGYTQTCAELMALLRPPEDLASLSTLPLGWRHFLGPDLYQAAARNLIAYAQFARQLEDRTGVRVALALEPEPGCALERTSQVIDFWKNHLYAAAQGHLDEATLRRYLGVCYDTCHQAVQFESATESLTALSQAGIAIHKMQLSSALEFQPDFNPHRPSLPNRLAFAEPKFLHQTRMKTDAGIIDFDDLPEALSLGDFRHRWRTHYHVPLQAETLLQGGEVSTTRQDMLEAYHFALTLDLCRHFEVETYTWSVLPESERPKDSHALARALAREIEFVIQNTPADFVIRHRTLPRPEDMP